MAKFCWGDNAFSIPLTLLWNFASALLLGAIISRTDPAFGVGDAYPTQTSLRGVALVTIVYVLMLYTFYAVQIAIGQFLGKDMPDDVKAGAKYIADRTVGNTLEQAWPFMSAMWLYAIFVNPMQAKLLGWIYVLFRAPYGIFYGFYGTFNTLCEISTQVNYNIIAYLSFAVAVKCLSGNDLYAQVHAKSPWLMLLVFLGMAFLHFLILGLTGLIPAMVISNGVKWEKGYVDEEEDIE